jgi:hypothetical protein
LCRSASRAPNRKRGRLAGGAPESVGLDGAKLCALAAKFEEWKEANLVVVRHGKLAFEHYFRGFDLKGGTVLGSSISMRRSRTICAR